MVYRGISEEKEIQACAICKGPFEFWGTSRGFSLYRCRTCKLIHFIEMGNLGGLGQEDLGASEPELFRPEPKRAAPRRRKLQTQEAGEPSYRVVIGGGDRGDTGKTNSYDSGENYSDSHDEKKAAPFAGYTIYKGRGVPLQKDQ